MKLIISAAAMVMVVGTAMARPYVALRAGASALTMDTDQYMYQAIDAYRSTIAKGDIYDINAIYHAAVGYGFGPLRGEIEYGYGHYAFSGNWALNTPNGVPGSLPPNLSYPATYRLSEKLNMVMANVYYDILVFNRMFGRPYTGPDGAEHRHLRAKNSLFIMGGLGWAHLRDRARAQIDTSMAWGGYPLVENASNRLNRFAFSVGGGVTMGLGHDVNIDISYKYTDLGEYDEPMVRRDYGLHEVLVGLRYAF